MGAEGLLQNRLISPMFGARRLIVVLPIRDQLDKSGGAKILVVTYVVGVDAYRGGWVAVVLLDGLVRACEVYPRISELVAVHSEAQVIAVDIPIGLSQNGSRKADVEARRFVGPRAASVFPAPPRSILEAASYQDALARARSGGRGISAQSFALVSKIREVAPVAATDRRIFEVHPEVSFRAMAGSPIHSTKKSWNGSWLRRRLLHSKGIILKDELGNGGLAPVDDVLDAAAAGWSAQRVAEGVAQSLPDPPEPNADRQAVAIWY
ncbi:MAG: DUF429 domain-containing protein [Actinomycetota bacterium]|nr:DUF429 domain-containing protein [Actinomycetota bacterium]